METNTFRALQCPGLEAEDPQRSSLTTLRQKYGLLCVRARHGMEAVVADEAQGELLEVPVGSPLLLTEGVTYNGDGQVVECFQVVYRGDRFRFEFSTDGEKAWRLR